MRKTRIRALKAQLPKNAVDQIAMRSEQTMKKDENGNFRVRLQYFLVNSYSNELRKLKKEWYGRHKER